jgi:DNA polymerase III alpha subunit
VIRESKKGKFAKLTLESNYVFTNVLLWSEQFDKFEKIIESCEKSIVLVSGTISYDNRNKTNQLQSNEYTEFLVLN